MSYVKREIPTNAGSLLYSNLKDSSVYQVRDLQGALIKETRIASDVIGFLKDRPNTYEVWELAGPSPSEVKAIVSATKFLKKYRNE